MPSERFNGGTVTSRDRADLKPGEMQQSTGGYYRKNDQRLWKIGGRSTFGDTGTSTKVDGVHIAVFDDGTGRVLALSNNVIYSATISGTGLTGTFSSLKSGLTSASNLSVQHFNDRHYISSGDGTNRIQVLEDDGTIYDAGMATPTVAPTLASSSSGGLIEEPDSASGTFTNESLAWDADNSTYCNADLTAGSVTTTFSFASGTLNTGSGRKLIISWELAGLGIPKDFIFDGAFDDVGGGIEAGYRVTIKYEVSEDAGVTYTTHYNLVNTKFPLAQRQLSIDVTNGVDVRDVRVKVTFTYSDGVNTASLRIYEIRVQDGSISSTVSTTTGIYYAIGEFDQTRGHYSPPGDAVLVSLATDNAVVVTLPSTAKNTRATHWIIYRTADGGSTSQLAQIAQVPIAETSYTDDFTVWAYNLQPRPLVRQVSLTSSEGGTGVVPLDKAPPEMVHLFQHDGSICGLSRTNTRTMYYTPAGQAESWPEIFTVSKFMLEQNDQLQTGDSLGELIVIVAKGAIFRVIGLPGSVRSTFEAEVRTISGAPGGVGRRCGTKFSVSGEARYAYISHEGLIQTNGYQHYRISDDFDWSPIEDFDKSNWALGWDERRLCLVFSYSSTSGGNNDRYALFHMHPEHRKENGQPKWTGPHYGAIHALGSGQVGNLRRLYSAHPSNGIVYVEDSGTTDTSNSYDSSSTNPFILKSRRLQGDDEFSVLGASLRHTDFGNGQKATVVWTTGRDSNDNEQVVTKSVGLNGQKKTFFDVALGGGWTEWQITHTGNATGALLDLPFTARSLGPAGEVKIG